MTLPVYKQLFLSEIDTDVRSLFSGTGRHGDHQPLIYQTNRAPATISQWISEDSERPSPIATALLLQCSIDRAFPQKGEKVWQIIERFRNEMLGLGRELPETDELPDVILFRDFNKKWLELMTAMKRLCMNDQQKQRFFLRARSLVHSGEMEVFGAKDSVSSC